MSKVKSFSVGNGDMFYIKHYSDNFSIIDCCLDENTREGILSELKTESINKGVTRFISTHPDEDHIQQLDYLDEHMPISNFYVVQNDVKKDDITSGFKRYSALRDGSKAYNISKGCQRKWMNQENEERGSSGIRILWPDRTNQHFKDALTAANNGHSPNNISPIILYSIGSGVKYQWMGDLETQFMEDIKDDISLSKVHVLFAPHHGRDSGKIPKSMLEILDPDIIVIGEAPSEHLNYYKGYNTITQNSAGDITFVNEEDEIHIYVSNSEYKVSFLENKEKAGSDFYLGTLNIKQ